MGTWPGQAKGTPPAVLRPDDAIRQTGRGAEQRRGAQHACWHRTRMRNRKQAKAEDGAPRDRRCHTRRAAVHIVALAPWHERRRSISARITAGTRRSTYPDPRQGSTEVTMRHSGRAVRNSATAA